MNLAVMYHYVREPEEWKGSVPISPRAFEEQIDRLSKTYEFILPDDLKKKTAKRKCILTFDDATKDQYEIAFDIMQRKGVPGYFTVMSGPLVEKEVPVFHLVHAALSLFEENVLWDELRLQLTQRDFLSLDSSNDTYFYEQSQLRKYIKYALNFLLNSELSKNFLEKMVYSQLGSKQKFIDNMYINVEEFQKMKRAGMALGVHCVHHTPFDGRGEEYYQREIVPCAEFMQEQLHMIPTWYTPPFGGGEKKILMMESLQDILLSDGYKGAFTNSSGIIDDPSSFWFNRFDCNDNFLVNLL